MIVTVNDKTGLSAARYRIASADCGDCGSSGAFCLVSAAGARRLQRKARCARSRVCETPVEAVRGAAIYA
jgi:hypothetical protein